MKKQFKDTPIAANFATNMGTKRYMNYDASTVELAFRLLASGICEVLSFKKSKTESVAVEIRDMKGNFKFAGIVQYMPETENSDTGNWVLSFTFNEEDVEDINTRYNVNDNDCNTIIDKDGYNRYGMQFSSNAYIFDILEEVVDTLKEYLDLNATAEEPLEVEVPGHFVASVQFEDGEKCMSITPSANMKQIVKEDKAV